MKWCLKHKTVVRLQRGVTGYIDWGKTHYVIVLTYCSKVCYSTHTIFWQAFLPSMNPFGITLGVNSSYLAREVSNSKTRAKCPRCDMAVSTQIHNTLSYWNSNVVTIYVFHSNCAKTPHLATQIVSNYLLNINHKVYKITITI